MFNFDLKKTAIYQAIMWERNPFFRFTGFFKKGFLILLIIFFLLFLYGFFADAFSQLLLSKLLGFYVIFSTLFLICWNEETFFNTKIKNPRLKTAIKTVAAGPQNFNLAEFLSFEAAKAVAKSIKFAQRKKLSEISSTTLFYFLLKDNPNLNFIFSRVLLNLNEIEKILKNNLIEVGPRTMNDIGPPSIYSNDFQKTILEAVKIAENKRHERIEIGDVLTGLAKHDLIFKKILIDANLKTGDIENLAWWLESLEERIKEGKKWWEYKNLIKRGTLAKNWAAGYTITLDRFSIDLSELVKRESFPAIIGHQVEIKAMERILSGREANSVLIVGESGSGRKSMVQALAIKSVLGESLPEVNFKRVVQLDLSALLTQVGSPKEAGSILDIIFREVLTAGNIILVIDEFHNFVGSVSRPGVIDISGVIAPYLRLPQFQVVGICTFEGLHRYIEQNPSILSLFEKVEVSEISERETLMLLENLALILERKYRKFISYPALRDIINYCAKYLPATPFPEKAVELLDEVMVYLTQTPSPTTVGRGGKRDLSLRSKDKILLPKHIAKIISEKVQIPVGEIESKEREVLLNLENLIHQRIINQEEAVKEVSAALRRARTEIQIRKGPMGTFLFLGPTGVGKTETSKALAEIYFGSEDRMIRLDMSEFQAISDIPRLIGSPGEEGFLTTRVREKPFSLILLDEIEKAHPNILNLFLQVLDEGHLTDGLGRKVDFKNSIIIATSNAGYQVILEALKKGKLMSEIKGELLDFLFKEGVFRPEFINRFDAVVIFKSLTKENFLQIAELLLQKLKKNLKEKDIDFIITETLKEKITELGYDPVFGARQMRRVIQDKVENALAQALLSGALKRGNKVEVDSKEFKLKINP